MTLLLSPALPSVDLRTISILVNSYQSAVHALVLCRSSSGAAGSAGNASGNSSGNRSAQSAAATAHEKMEASLRVLRERVAGAFSSIAVLNASFLNGHGACFA